MSVRRQRRWMIACLVAALAALSLLAVPAAQAAPPGPTKLFLQFHGPGDHAGQEIKVIANVRPADGGPEYPTGSVVFSVGDGTPVPVDPQYLTASITTTIPSNAPFAVTAAFTGTGGWEDSTATATFTPLQNLFWDPQPTIAKIGAGGLKLSLSFSTYRRNSLGAGVPGREIAFTLFQPVPNVSLPNKSNVPVCTAVTDANGLAKCSANVLLAVVVSLLAGGGYASDMSPPIAGLDSVHLPAIKVG